MSDAKKSACDHFEEVRDKRGRFVVRFNPRTMEVARSVKGEERRGKLTDFLQDGYTKDQKPHDG